MSYPGNSSLADEVQQKILSTFLQTLGLAEEGRKEEALLGCDFIRRLDPLFKPAEELLARLEEQEGAVPVDDLRAQVAGLDESVAKPSVPSLAAQEVDELFGELDQPTEMEDFSSLGLGESDLETESDSPLDVDLDLSSFGTTEEESTPEPEAEPELEPETEAESEAEPDSSSTSAAEPSAALDRESEERVEQLLGEGQAAFAKTEYQSAIDAWSRIFLIDIDHPEANRRIELARKLKAEVERKVEEMYHEALTAMEGGDLEAAAERFRKVLQLQPSHLAAQEHLDRLSADKAAPERDSALGELPDLAPRPDDETPQLGDFSPDELPESDFGFEPLASSASEADFGSEAGADAIRPEALRRPSRRTTVVIAGLVLVIAVIAAWFLRSNWTRVFPNAGEEVVTPQKPKVDPIVRAQGLHVAGDTAMAISQLRRLPPAHPQYAEAQALIAQWETVLDEGSEDGPSEEQLAERDRLIARAREAFANREFLSAQEFFSLASQAAPLEEGALALQAETLERLEPLRSEIEIFRQGEWGFALRDLWEKHEADPEDRDVLRLMIDGYFNLGVRDLQRGDPLSAAENLSEAASLAPNDAEIQRLLDFAADYTQRQPDLLYRIFVK
jgi:tetratricopeptide (TPR) repeat protein